MNDKNKIFKVTKAGFIYCCLVLAVGIIGLCLINYFIAIDSQADSTLVICTIISLIVMTVQHFLFLRYRGSLTSNYSIFIITFVVFHFGLFLVYSMGGSYNYYYLKSYDTEIVIDTLKFQYLCVEMLYIAGTFVNRIRPYRFSAVNQRDETSVFRLSRQFLVVAGGVSFILLLLKVLVFFRGYYNAVRTFEQSIPSIISLVEYFFIPLSVLAWIYSNDSKFNSFIKTLIIIWSIITALCGDRTSGIAGIIIALIIDVRFTNNEHINRKKYFLSMGLVGLSMVFAVFVKSFREGASFVSNGLISIFSEFLGELGSSYFPLTLIMRVCPSNHPYLLGKSYFYSIIAGFLPASIDPTGTLDRWNDLAIEPITWIRTDYDYSFGTGYSLCAEAYANFGWIGFVVLFVIALLIIKLLSYDKDNKFSQYVSTILLFEFFTLPRRNFYYVINHSVYCIIYIMALLLLFVKSRRA